MIGQPVDDPWDFPAETATADWSALLADQGTDLVIFAIFAAFALAGFYRKSVTWKYATLIASVVYLGFYKSQLLSIVNVFGLLSSNLPGFQYSLAWYLFAIFALVSTVLWGRFYCGRVCAFGALTQLMDRVVPSRWRIDVPRSIERRAALVKYGILAASVTYFIVTSDSSIYRYVEPFWMFSGQASTGLWIGLAVLLGVTIFVRNAYCRFLCPVGAGLGLLSTLTVFRIKRWSECQTCRICEKKCEWGAIRGPRILMTECVRCDDCERLYADRVKCPHWIISLRQLREGGRRRTKNEEQRTKNGTKN